MENEQQEPVTEEPVARNDFDAAWELAAGAPAEQAAAEQDASAMKQEGPGEPAGEGQPPQEGVKGPEGADSAETASLSMAELDAVRAERDALRAERDRHLATANSMKGRLQALQREYAGAERKSTPEPDPDSYASADAYLDALEKYEAQQEEAHSSGNKRGDSSLDATRGRGDASDFAPSKEELVSFEVSKRMEASRRESMISKAMAKHPDFKAVAMSEGVPISQTMGEALFGLGADDFAAAAYYLGKNPSEARDIASLGGQYGQIMQAQRIVNLAERLRAGQDAKSKEVERSAIDATAVPSRHRSGPPNSGATDKNDFDGAWKLATSGRSRRS